MMRYEVNKAITAEQFIDILRRSGLAERRPIEDLQCIVDMVANADLTVTAWENNLLVGVARSVTDWAYCCYLSDLAVDRDFQKRGIGRELIARTQEQLGPRCKLILLSAPSAVDYYPHIGMENYPQAWVLPRDQKLKMGIE
jgi:GNAT superfamily N-acetyltransferase